MRETYTVKEVARILGYSTNSIYTFLKEKRIKGVRVGRGRFRIPKTEVDRLLMATKQKSPQEATERLEKVAQVIEGLVPQQAATVGIQEQPHTHGTLLNGTNGAHVQVPSLFEWFVGLASILVGSSMFLFSRTFGEESISSFLPWMPAIRVILIAAGAGLLFSDMAGKIKSLWHALFHFAIAVSYTIYAAALFQGADWEGLVIYGVLSAILWFTFFVPFGGIASFAIYIALFTGILPVVALLVPQGFPLFAQFPILSTVNTSTAIYVWLAVAAVTTILLVLGYYKKRWLFWTGMALVSVLLIGLSLYWASQIYWGRSLVLLLTGLFCLFVPVWDTLEFTHKNDRKLVFTIFSSILALFLMVIFGVRMMQANMIEYANRELANKVLYGKILVDTTLEAAAASIESGANNALLITALGKEDQDQLIGLTKSFFESNRGFRRILLFSASGDLIAVYPHTTVDKANASFREYFVKATTDKKPYISQKIETLDDGIKHSVIAVSAPVISAKDEVIGVIVGSVDLLGLGNKLQTVATPGRNEYFVVVDEAGRRIVHPDRALLGIQVDENDPVTLGAQGKHGVSESYSTAGARSLTAYDALTRVKWGIAVKAPITVVLQTTFAASLAVFFVIVLSVLIVAGFLLSRKSNRIMTLAHSGVPIKIPTELREGPDDTS